MCAAAFSGLAVAILLSGSGCERKQIAARAQPPTVLKWKHHPQSVMGIPKGIVVEQRGNELRARLCDLKPGGQFTIDATLSDGVYLPARKAIIFPLGMPATMNVEQWVQAGGPHMSVPFDLHSSQLHANLASSGVNQSFHFTRY